MTWQAPITWTLNQVVTSAQLNAQIRDNMLETAAAKATGANRIFVSTGTNSIAQREIKESSVSSNQSDNMTDFADISGGTDGPTVTITTGTKALIWISSVLENSGANSTWASYGVTGASSIAIDENHGIYLQPGSDAGDHGGRVGATNLMSLTAGSNIFKMQYRVSGDTGTWQYRRLTVMAL